MGSAASPWRSWPSQCGPPARASPAEPPGADRDTPAGPVRPTVGSRHDRKTSLVRGRGAARGRHAGRWDRVEGVGRLRAHRALHRPADLEAARGLDGGGRAVPRRSPDFRRCALDRRSGAARPDLQRDGRPGPGVAFAVRAPDLGADGPDRGGESPHRHSRTRRGAPAADRTPQGAARCRYREGLALGALVRRLPPPRSRGRRVGATRFPGTPGTG